MDSGQQFNSVVFETEVVGGAGILGFGAVFLAELPHQGIVLCYIRKFVTEFKSWWVLGDDYFIFFLGYCDAKVMVTFSVVCVSEELLESVDYLFPEFFTCGDVEVVVCVDFYPHRFVSFCEFEYTWLLLALFKSNVKECPAEDFEPDLSGVDKSIHRGVES